MDTLNKEILQRFMMSPEKSPCVSIFVPTDKAGHQAQQAGIRLKNLLKDGEKKLQEYSLRPREIEDLLKPAQALVGDSLFWQHQQNGLAIFLAPGFFEYYRLPIDVRETVVVSHRFHIKPLLPLFTMGDRFFVLALSQKHVRLLQCTPHSVVPIELKDAPESIDDVLKYDDPEKQVQFHTRAPEGSDGYRAAISYGHGDENYEEKENLRRYAQEIDKSLIKTIGNTGAPLVFAGVDYLFPIFRDTSRYQGLADKPLEGNPESLRDEKLQEMAWKKVEPMFQKEKNRALARYHELCGTGKTSTDLEEVALGARNGRVEILFVATGVRLHGTIDHTNNSLKLNTGSESAGEDILDYAACQTYLQGGSVYPVSPPEVPGEHHIAAVFRY